MASPEHAVVLNATSPLADATTVRYPFSTATPPHIDARRRAAEAVIDLFCYLLKCGLKYVSDYSLGAVKCDYQGLQGTCELSVNYLNAFAKMNRRRAKDIAQLTEDGIYDAEYIAKVNEYLNDRGRYIWGPHTGVSVLTGYDEITKMPPESAIPAIKTKYQNSLNTYNKLYINS